MKSGAQVQTALKELGFQPRDIVVTKQGEWLENGLVHLPHNALSTADVVFIAMHGAYGEDGTVQRICERLHIPFTGSNSFASSTAFNKHLTKHVLRDTEIKLPRHILVRASEVANLSSLVEAIADYADGYVVKPVASGSSHGVSIATDADILQDIMLQRLQSEDTLLIEERIVGTEATVGILDDFRDCANYALPAIEIVPPAESDHFDQHNKYNGQTVEICPGRFSLVEKTAMSEATQLIHQLLGLSHYSRADFIVRQGQPYFLEINTLPGLTSESLFPKAAQAIGLEFPQLIQHLVATAKVR